MRPLLNLAIAFLAAVLITQCRALPDEDRPSGSEDLATGLAAPTPYGWNPTMEKLAARGEEALDIAFDFTGYPDPVVRRNAVVVAVAMTDAACRPRTPYLDPQEQPLPSPARDRVTERLLLLSQDEDPTVAFYALRGLLDLHGRVTGSPQVQRLWGLLGLASQIPVPYDWGMDEFDADDRADMVATWHHWWRETGQWQEDWPGSSGKTPGIEDRPHRER